MLVSGIIATASLTGILVLMLVSAVVLALVDKKVDAGRIH
jgi:hypothetical protein